MWLVLIRWDGRWFVWSEHDDREEAEIEACKITRGDRKVTIVYLES